MSTAAGVTIPTGFRSIAAELRQHGQGATRHPVVAPLKQKGDLAEPLVAADLRRRGYLISLPYGEDSPYDLVLEGRSVLSIRLTPTRNGQTKNTRWWEDYTEI